MTNEELEELKRIVIAGFYVDDTDGDEEFFRVISKSNESMILDLITAEQQRRSVRKEDVQKYDIGDALNDLRYGLVASETNGLYIEHGIKQKTARTAITALEQMIPKEEQSTQSESQPCDVYELAVYKKLGITSERAYQLIEMEKSNNDI